MYRKKFQAKRSDFGSGWVKVHLASDYPKALFLETNIFTNNIRYVVGTKDLPEEEFSAFDEALERFNEL